MLQAHEPQLMRKYVRLNEWGQCMEVLLVLLGAVLALLGGLASQRYQMRLQRNADEKAVLLEANDALLKLHAIMAANPTATVVDVESISIRDHREFLDVINALTSCAIRLQTRKYREIAVRLTRIALDAHVRTDANVYELTRQVQLEANGNVILTYERELQESPQAF